MTTDELKRVAGLLAEDRAQLIEHSGAGLFPDAELHVRWVGITDAERKLCEQALAEYTWPTLMLLGTPQDWVQDPVIRWATFKGIWRAVSTTGAWTEDSPTATGGQRVYSLTWTLRLGFITTLKLTVPGIPPAPDTYKIDFSSARLCRPEHAARMGGQPELNPLAEMFHVVFCNLDPSKLDAMLADLRACVPYAAPTIQGNALEGNYVPIRMRGQQAIDGSGVIVLYACKGGRNLGNLELGEAADRLTVQTEGGVAYTEFAYFWRQTFDEIVALRSKLEALGGTAGINVTHQLRETDEGGPYELFVEIRYQGNQTGTGWQKRVDQHTVTVDDLAAAQPSEPTRAGGTTLEQEVVPRGDGLFRVKTATTTGDAVTAGPVEIFNDGLVSHKATFCLNAASVPETNHDGAETNTTTGSDPRRVVYLHAEYNHFGLWNFVKLEIRVLASSLRVSTEQAKQVEMEMKSVPKINYVPAGTSPVTPAYWYSAGEQPHFYWALKRLNGQAVVRSFYLVPTPVTDGTGDGWERRNGFDNERMVWFIDTVAISYGTWQADESG